MVTIFTNTIISTWTPGQVASLTPQQIKLLTTNQITQLNSAQINSLSVTQIAALTSTQIGAFTANQVQGFPSLFIHSLSASQISQFNSSQLAQLSTNNVGLLSLTQIQALTPTQVASLNYNPNDAANFLSKLNSSQLNTVLPKLGVSAACLLSADQVHLLSTSTLAVLSSDQINAMTPNAISGLSSNQIGSLSTTQFHSLSSNSANALSSTQIQALSSSQVMALSINSQEFNQILSKTSVVQLNQLAAQLGTDSLSSLGSKQLTQLLPTTISSLNNNQVSALNSSNIHSLMSAQIKALSNYQLGLLSTDAISGLTSQQISALSPVQISSLAPTTQEMLNLLSQINTDQLNQIIPNLNTAAIAALSNKQIASLSVSSIQALSSVQIQSLSLAGIQVLSTSQIQALNLNQLKALSSSSVGALSVGQILALSAAQVSVLALTPGQILGILNQNNSSQLNYLLSSLGSQIIPLLSANQISQLTTSSISSLSATQIQSFTSKEIGELTTTQLQSLSTTQLQAFGTQDISALTSSDIQALSSAQILSLEPSIEQLSVSFNHLNAAQLNQVLSRMDSTAIVELSAQQIQTLSASTISALSSSQVQALTTNIITNLSTTQIQGLQTIQIGYLSTKAISALNSQQLGALSTNDLVLLTTQQLAGLNSIALNGLSRYQISSLSSNQLNFLKNAQSQLTITTSSPSWVSGLQDSVLRADMTLADSNGVVTESGMAKVFTDLASELSSSNSKLSSSQITDLRLIASDINSGESASSYLIYITNALINGNVSNAQWTGGASSATSLVSSSNNPNYGLVAGVNANVINELTGKWFLGTDLPSSTVAMQDAGKSSTFSINYSSNTISNTEQLFQNNSPKYTDVNQGQLGDCYFESTIAELALQNPSALESMFINNNNGTYGVRFYQNGVAEYVTVDSQTPLLNGQNIFNQTPSTVNTGIWVNLLEKAFAQAQSSGVLTGNPSAAGSLTNSYTAIGNGGYSDAAMLAILGTNSTTDLVSYKSSSGLQWLEETYSNGQYHGSNTFLNSTSVMTALNNSFNEGFGLTLNSVTNAQDASGKTTLVASHQFAVVGVDTVNQSVELYNPWGSQNNQTWDTTFNVSVNTLLADGDLFTNSACAPSIAEAWSPTNIQQILPNTSTKLTGLQISDQSAGSNQINVQLSSSTLSLGLANSSAFGVQVLNNNSKNMTLEGNLASINSALANISATGAIPSGYANTYALIGVNVLDNGTGLQFSDPLIDQVEITNAAIPSSSLGVNASSIQAAANVLVAKSDPSDDNLPLIEQCSQSLSTYLNAGKCPVINDSSVSCSIDSGIMPVAESNSVSTPLLENALNTALKIVQPNSSVTVASSNYLLDSQQTQSNINSLLVINNQSSKSSVS